MDMNFEFEIDRIHTKFAKNEFEPFCYLNAFETMRKIAEIVENP